MPATSLHTHGCRVSDEWTFRGMRAAVLENDVLRIVVLLDRGAEIVEFRYKPLDMNPLARWGELRNPKDALPSVAASSGTFLDYYVGGWQEIVPNGGPPVTHKGAEYGQHGEVCLVPWASQVIDDTPNCVSLRCTVRAPNPASPGTHHDASARVRDAHAGRAPDQRSWRAAGCDVGAPYRVWATVSPRRRLPPRPRHGRSWWKARWMVSRHAACRWDSRAPGHISLARMARRSIYRWCRLLCGTGTPGAGLHRTLNDVEGGPNP